MPTPGPSTGEMSVMIYTGYSYEDLVQDPDQNIKRILDCTDILVDGTYMVEEDHNEMWRGSLNQRILFLTDRYKEWEWVRSKKKRTLYAHHDKNGRYVILGIPPKKANKKNNLRGEKREWSGKAFEQR